jgi:two-component system, NarL family, response regulator DegU
MVRKIEGEEPVMSFSEPEPASNAPVRSVRIMIVDDQAVVRESLKNILATEPQFEIVAELESGEDALEQIETVQPDIVLMDIHMPRMDGLQATRRLKEQSPGCEVLMLTAYEDPKYLRQALSAGASGYILKGTTRRRIGAAELIEAIKTVAEGGSLISPALLRTLIQEFAVQPSPAEVAPPPEVPRTVAKPAIAKEYQTRLALLTRREKQVLGLIGQGLSNSLIAQNLTISQDTVKTHVRAILEKLELTDRTQAAVFAVRAQLT